MYHTFLYGKANEVYIYNYKRILFETVYFSKRIKPFKIGKFIFDNRIALPIYPLEVKIL